MATKIYDISDKGRKQGKTMRYEVGLFCKPINNPEHTEEIPEYTAKFKRHGDAYYYATWLANSPDATMVIIRS